MSEVKKTICLQLVNVKKDYIVDSKPFTAINDFSCCFAKKGFVAILGHSGSGKTTLLNIIGGLDHYTDGDLLIDGNSTKGYADKDWDNYRNKRIGFVFQTYNLIPHLNILQNVELSLQLGGVGKKEREARAKNVLERVGLGELIKKKPNQLSGGQMQRVAIARALVNDPDIILADEPTGALDSSTSTQVMDLIKEVGKDRCVILVTHNREIAEVYADRIIEMKDGKILSDSNPINPEETVTESRTVGKKSAMSFKTSFKSALRSISTKKGRTAITAIACSIGIIGVALVLAMANGFSDYVSNVEVSLANTIPISINPITYQTQLGNTTHYDEYPKDNTVHVYEAGSSIVTPVSNNFSQEYFDYLNRMVNDPNCAAYGSTMSILYNHNGLNFHFLANAPDGIREIDQYRSAGSLGSTISSVTSLPATIIHELYGDEDKMSNLYDTIAGRFPTQADEMVLVLDRYNRIDFSTMKALGYYKSDQTFRILTDEEKNISFDEILYKDEEHPGKVQFKCYTNSSYYQLPEKPEDLPSIMRTFSVNSYSNYKIKDFVLSADESRATYQDLARPDAKDVYENDEKHQAIKMKIVGVLRPTESSYLQLMPTSLAYTGQLTKIMTDDVAEGTSSHALGEIQKRNWFINRDTDNPSNDGLASLNAILAGIKSLVSGTPSDTDIATAYGALSSALPGAVRYMSVAGYTNASARFTSVSGFLGHCRNFGVEFEKVTDYTPYITKMLLRPDSFLSQSESQNIVDLIAYTNSYSLVSSILIFPSSLTSKGTIHEYLDGWNETHADNKIVYSDIMEDLTGGLDTLISVISAVLIVLASISLIVSSVMTSIITYVSVIERTKEIGVLRACGGRKKDVSRLFQSECMVIGISAGIIGILVTIVVCVPINIVLQMAFPGNNLGSIASLNPGHALILLVISVLLALLSGFVPARIAAKKDPVVCLRSE